MPRTMQVSRIVALYQPTVTCSGVLLLVSYMCDCAYRLHRTTHPPTLFFFEMLRISTALIESCLTCWMLYSSEQLRALRVRGSDNSFTAALVLLARECYSHVSSLRSAMLCNQTLALSLSRPGGRLRDAHPPTLLACDAAHLKRGLAPCRALFL